MASSTPRPVPTQRAISQQAANSMAANPMASNPMAANPMATNVSAANIQAMQRLMSPPPAHAQMAQPPPLPSQQPAPLTSPMVTNASLAATDLRRASVASGPYSAPHPQQQQQQHPGTLTHVATTGPQLPSTVRQQTMPAAMGMSAAELGLHNTTMAMAAATAGLNGRTPNQAMFAYVQHQQQQQQQMAAHLGAFGQGGMGQGLPPQIPRPQTTVGAGASEAGHMAGPMLGGMPGMGAPDAMASGNPGLHQPTPQTAVGFQPGMSMADARQQYMLLHMQGAHPAGSPHVAAGIPQALQQHPHALMAGSATPPVPHKRPDAGPMDASMAGAQPLPPKKAPKAKVRRTKKNGKASATPSEGVAVRKADNGSPAAAKSAGQSPPFLGGLGAESGGMGLGDPSALTALLARGSTGDLASAISAMGAPIDPSLGLNINDLLGGSSEALNDILNMDAMGDSSGSGISSQVLDAYSMGGDALTSLLATSGVNAINALPMAAGLASTGAPPAPTADAVFSPAAASGHNM
ncbi:hypothetical protein IWW52_004761 [Coemansia sp. RSA 2704]|nr:hypothetical protein IWW52_004761 [Coemansia sp. RSA 2704]